MHRSRRTLLHAPEMEDDISHIESHPITVAEIFSSSFYLPIFIFQFWAQHFSNSKVNWAWKWKEKYRNSRTSNRLKKDKNQKNIYIFSAKIQKSFMSDIKKKLKNRKKSKIFPKIESKNIDCVKQNPENLSRLQKSK